MYNSNPKTPSDYAIIIAIDWADQKHDFRIRRGNKDETKVISNNLRELKEFFIELIEEAQWQQVAVVIENCRSALMNLMQTIQQLDIYAVHPIMSSRFAQTFHPSGAKSDVADTESLMELYLKHYTKIKPLKHSKSQSNLEKLNTRRRHLVDERTRLTNQLTAHLKIYYPTALGAVGSYIHADIFLAFLEKYSSPQDVLSCAQIGLTKFFNKRTSNKGKTKERVKALRESIVVVEDREELDIYVFETLQYCKRITGLNQIVKAYEAKIKEQYLQNEDFEIFSSLPGAGPAIGPRIMAFFGNDRNSFNSVEDALRASEIAPVKIESGKMCIVRRRFLCDRFTQLSFVEFANNSRKSSLWAQEFYTQKKAKGMAHFCILRALAYKWIRIIYRCWKSRTPYDESIYIKALNKRPNSLFKNMEKS